MLFLFTFSICCGGGGGGGNSTAETTTTSDQISISGTADFSELSKSSFAPKKGEVSLLNIRTNEETITTLNSDGSFVAKVAKGDNEVTVLSSTNKIVKTLIVDAQADTSDINPNKDTTTVMTYMHSIASTSISEFSVTELQSKFTGAETILKSADNTLTNQSSGSKDRSAALALLAIGEKIKEMNSSGNIDDMLSVSTIKSNITSLDIINNLASTAITNVFNRTNKSVYVPSINGDLTLNSVVEITNNQTIINTNVTIFVNIIDTFIQQTNNVPVSNAGTNRTVGLSSNVILNGSKSYDVDASDTISYAWSQVSGTIVSLSSLTSAQPTFTAPSIDSVLEFELIVSDGTVNSKSASVVITVSESNKNLAPIANASTDQSIAGATTVTLNGSSSSDPNNDVLSYSWIQTSGETVTLSNQIFTNPTFTAPTKAQTLEFSLKVNDGIFSSDADIVKINILNITPIANAGSDQTVRAGRSITLDASGSSDANGDSLQYVWLQLSGNSVTLSSNTSSTTSFTSNSFQDNLEFSLKVYDGITYSEIDKVKITLTNSTPIANAGNDQTVKVNSLVSLVGSSSSDADNDSLTYLWSQISGNTISLSSNTSSSPTFTSHSFLGNLVFSLIVNDGLINSVMDTVNVFISNNSPIADAGSNQIVKVNTTVTLSADNSSDVDNDSLTYLWTQIGGNTVTLSADNVSRPSFTTNLFSDNLIFQVVVNDGLIDSPSDNVTITADFKLSQITNFSASANVVKNILTWDSLPEAESYSIYWSTSSSVSIANSEILSNVSSPYEHTTVEYGNDYYYTVMATNNNENSLLASEVQASPYFGNIKDIDTNESSSLILTSDNVAWAIGRTQTNDGQSQKVTKPTQMMSNVIDVSRGYGHSLVVKEDRTVWAWGRNSSAELGDGTLVDKLEPIQVTGLSNITQVIAGSLYSAALQSNGNVWLWGMGVSGFTQKTPILMSGLSNVTSLIAGSRHHFALTSNGNIYAWGENNYGQLGDGNIVELGSESQSNYGKVVLVSVISDIKQIVPSYRRTMVLKNDGTVWQWGKNETTTFESTTPTQVSGLSNITAISGKHFTSMAVTSDGKLYAWGGMNDYFGLFGDGTNTNSETPVLSLFTDATALLHVSFRHVIAVKSDGSVWGWGGNGSSANGVGNSIFPLLLK